MATRFQQVSSSQPRGWVKGKAIGFGSQGNVHLAMNKATEEIFVVKSAHSSNNLKSLENEAFFLENLNSPYIVQYLGKNISKDENRISIFMEYMSKGSVSDVAETYGRKLDEGIVRLYTKEILHGLKYIHEQNIVHCDIKCKNVLIDSSGNVKLADFGCAKRVNNLEKNGNLLQDIGGTPLWMAPEVLRKERLDFASDIWSLGCTVIEMVSGMAPWSAQLLNPMAAVLKIAYSDEKPQLPAYFSDEGLDFLEKCLERNPDKRWTAEQLLDHPFISGKSQREFVRSPVSVFDIGIFEDFYYDESEIPNEDDFRGRNPFSMRYCEERKRIENDFGASDDWITVRSV
ncbi:hypothetical protein JCGZ_00268 [Jatropha curcas]|uniref:Protein kinase domain-containing protein n=1 Tax=Jatropha curcas TaxID=180498 RepID=A0A067L1W9_JATCU|nr:mitogen-activated protein kinase kinase kinase 17 [Jatropha curcas]KDP42471.1 hypothetical protein JCGZ_00268 [Jatropha curcas]